MIFDTLVILYTVVHELWRRSPRTTEATPESG